MNQRLVPSNTILRSSLPDFTIEVFYGENQYQCPLQPEQITTLPYTLEAQISETEGGDFLNGLMLYNGHLYITMNNTPADIDYEVNSNGNLIVKTSVQASDANRYSIDENGHLIYDFC